MKIINEKESSKKMFNDSAERSTRRNNEAYLGGQLYLIISNGKMNIQRIDKFGVKGWSYPKTIDDIQKKWSYLLSDNWREVVEDMLNDGWTPLTNVNKLNLIKNSLDVPEEDRDAFINYIDNKISSKSKMHLSSNDRYHLSDILDYYNKEDAIDYLNKFYDLKIKPTTILDRYR